MAVRVKAVNDSTIEADTPVPLFPTNIGGALQELVGAKQQYVVSPDGQRFLMNTLIEEETPPISIILNWQPR
jgi:hypothetical protein